MYSQHQLKKAVLMNRTITLILLLLISTLPALSQQRSIDEEFLNAVEKKDIPRINLLLKQGANINTQDRVNGYFALQYAINWPDISLVTLLLDKGANVNLADQGGNTALTEAAGRRGPENAAIVKLLIARGANIHANNDVAIIDAARIAEPEVVKLLLARGAPANARHKDRDNNTVLMEAASGGSVENVKLILDAGADLKAINENGQTALMKAVKLDHTYSPEQRLPIIELLLSKGADINQKDNSGQTPLLLSVDQYMSESGGVISHPEVVKLLLDRGADVHAVNQRGDNAFMITTNTWRGSLEIAKLLVEKGINLNSQNEKGTTALMIAVEGGKSEVVTLLLDRGVDLKLKDKDGMTALDVAVNNGRLDIAKLLFTKGAPSASDYKTEAELTKATTNYALLRAASTNNLNEIKETVASGADLNTRDRRGFTALMRAIESSYGRNDAAKFLIERGSDVNAVDNNGNTSLIIAIEHSNDEAVVLLIENKAAVYPFNKDRKTALHLAAGQLRRKSVAALLSVKPEVSASSAGVDLRGVDVNALDASGRTPLMLAADNESFVPDEVMELLLSKGAQIDLQDPQGNTALILSVKAGSLSGVEFLLSKSASVNLKNNEGQTALKLAREIHEKTKLYNAQLVEDRVVEMLQRAGAKE